MKNKNIHQWFQSLGLAMAVAALAFGGQSVFAQQKGAEKLMKLNKVEDLQKVEPGDTVVMSCPKCKDTYVQVVERSFKGATVAELKKAPIHLCSSCDTKIVTKGTGKNAQETLVHTCKTCGSEDVSCCVMKKNGGTTQGMEKK